MGENITSVEVLIGILAEHEKVLQLFTYGKQNPVIWAVRVQQQLEKKR